MSITSPNRGASLPDSIQPELARSMFPKLNADDLRLVKAAGWKRVGILAAILDEERRFLVLRHKRSDKTPEGAFGPLAETAQLAQGAKGIQVESTAHTLSRALHEELGVSAASIRLRARRIGAWTLNSWPVGTGYAGQKAFAICPVVYIGDEGKEQLLDTFQETPEIRGIDFRYPQDMTHELVRPGTHEWLEDVMVSGLVSGSQIRGATAISLPRPTPLSDAVDIKFDSMPHL